MKRIILAAIAGTALLGLGACNNTDADDTADDAADSTTIVEPAPLPTVTATDTTTVIDDGDTDTDGEPDVEATIGPDPSATVKTD